MSLRFVLSATGAGKSLFSIARRIGASRACSCRRCAHSSHGSRHQRVASPPQRDSSPSSITVHNDIHFSQFQHLDIWVLMAALVATNSATDSVSCRKMALMPSPSSKALVEGKDASSRSD